MRYPDEILPPVKNVTPPPKSEIVLEKTVGKIIQSGCALGCLGFALLPWLLGGLIVLITFTDW